ncbi:terpenoid synthase [Daedaleopsis nitida]|nr:terpenoid synthase [Daedaleopsis nitida]
MLGSLLQIPARLLSLILSPVRHHVYQASNEPKTICEAPKEHSEYEEDRDLSDEAALKEIKQIVRDFVKSMSYRSMHTSQIPHLRKAVRAEVTSWEGGLSPSFIDALTDTSCSMVENAYSHTTYEHQFLIARYTAGVVFADDLGERNVEAVGQFAQRFTRGEPQMHPVLDRMVDLLRTMHDYYPRVSADAIIANTLDAFTWMFVELTTKGMAVEPAAGRYMMYLRFKAGIGAAFPHFSYTKNWAENAGLYYLQTLPDLEIFTVSANDILSFYKEALAGEKDNYIHMRAATERKPVIQVLREVVDETLDSVRKLEIIESAQPGLAPVCQSYIMGSVDFHYKAGRYRLQDLDLSEADGHGGLLSV